MKRLYKNKARKAYDNGTILVMVPCLMAPTGPWGFSMEMHKDYFEKKYDKEFGFDTIVREFEIHNCCYETGYYAAFYVKE